MGYLAQRKNSARKAVFLFIATMVFFAVSALSLIYEPLKSYIFQIFMLVCIAILYAIVNRFWRYALINTILSVVLFFMISSSTALFYPYLVKDAKTNLRVLYQNSPSFLVDTFEDARTNNADISVINNPQKLPPALIEILPRDTFVANGENIKNGFIVSSFPITSFAEAAFSSTDKTTFAIVDINGQKLGIMGVDWQEYKPEQVSEYLWKLKEFIAKRDEPVIVFGNFNAVPWQANFAEFLNQTGLEIKNPIVFEWKNVFIPNKFFVLGYKNMNFKNFIKLPKKDNQQAPYLLELEMFTQN